MSIYDTLNNEQRKAVFCTEGPLLMLAGAGSGKTRSLTHRIAYLIEEKGVAPWNILAITFTNKAAQEMRERVDALVGYGSEDIWISTFHATCSRILRRHIDLLGYDRNFTIYDASDQKSLMKEVLKEMKIDTKQFPERSVMSEISSAKNEYKSPLDYRNEYGSNFRNQRIADIYEHYQKRLKENNALDFDDLLVKMVDLFQTNPDVLEHYQDRFQYIMVDEYQDTNTVQFLLVSLLAKKYRNLCVVGDDDQSIYKFRGANIYNILNFEKVFPDAQVIRLEQNYRSTQNILNAANGVIANNKGRKEKKLWTENQKGELVHFKQYDTEYDEADGVVSRINFLAMRGVQYKDMAILYRTNAQSRIFEEKLKQKNIPYAIVRGISFYDRKEIKDLMSYLKVVDSGMDDLSVKRIINVPKRGIGQTTINRLQEFAILNQMSFLDAVFNADEIPEVTRALAKLHKFADMIEEFREYASEHEISELLEHILDVTQYRAELEAEGTDESISRLEDIEELFNDIAYYEEEEENPNLRDFLAEKDMYTLNAGIDNLEDENNKVLLMTLHNAKGLEFNNVFLGGMEEGVFPGFGAMMSGDESEIEEERRLCYVGITRAKERLFLSAAKRRMLRGQTQYNRRSRFIDEIPGQYLDTEQRVSEQRVVKNTERPAKYQYGAKAGKPYNLSDFKVKPVGELDYQIGDRVKHIKFGVGTVQEITKGGRDFEVAVEFDRVGRKKMFASFAKLKKVK
ncbi:ATP-dependent DNA helicase pcrA [Anaerobutyricum hallii]|jgi:DNA helicase-2/ATP-dependent DNA helicase PcrA|uniref:ATP-dependent DNA helicase n=1 Tax=Anaerobutyricum hallii TaxID=39488 RepID=A0A174JZ27_9FIRM|nr:DNA helicase PcrA [Anaerobutyricum hallii]MBP0061952.1 DNA helicase PcrA [Anaerobutyricum hallii]RGI89174.1 DNA helicase PcrA [Anaerobutyricum hallii]RGZ79090.1 DNA helicase PcrA [Anaerobutyricum hallii]RHK38146.1 DNA helicase PcrA [Anaerobutyricum hallii]CUP05093.1 ATP-dependent DNA helicase pcrA [Anaerobutyricum hallii]